MTRPLVRVGVPVLLAALAVLGGFLVLTGGSDGSATGSGPEDGSRARLPIEETDIDSVAELAGLELPDSTDGFLSARLDDDSQLDVTFTIDPADEAGFLRASELPEPEADERVITHQSPLWELNVDGTIRGAADTHDGVTRAIELVEEDGRVRVRLVLTPSG